MIQTRLAVLLAERQMKLTELETLTGVALNNLSILKTGKAKAIRFSTLNEICRALDCQPGDILSYEPEDRSGSTKSNLPRFKRTALGLVFIFYLLWTPFTAAVQPTQLGMYEECISSVDCRELETSERKMRFNKEPALVLDPPSTVAVRITQYSTLEFTLSQEAAKKLSDLSRRNLGKKVALAGLGYLSFPRMTTPLDGGVFQIEFGQTDASRLQEIPWVRELLEVGERQKSETNERNKKFFIAIALLSLVLSIGVLLKPNRAR